MVDTHNEWKAVYYNGLETNIEVTKCGRVRRVKVDWLKYTTSAKLGEVDFSKLKTQLKRYKQIGIQIKKYGPKICKVHQLVASAFLDYKWNGNNFVVDHIDSNKDNNHVNNLRVISNRENSSKEVSLKRGLPTGVHFDKCSNKFKAQILINKKKIHLGLFSNPQEASNVYQLKLKSL
jgi:hypothetical protein